MDADTKTLLKELNDKIQDEKTDIETQKECIKIMISMLDNYDLTDKPARICPTCSRLKHISLFPISNNPRYDMCRLCGLNITGNVRLVRVKCEPCNQFLLIAEGVSKDLVIQQHTNTLKHQRRVRGSHYLV